MPIGSYQTHHYPHHMFHPAPWPPTHIQGYNSMVKADLEFTKDPEPLAQISLKSRPSRAYSN